MASSLKHHRLKLLFIGMIAATQLPKGRWGWVLLVAALGIAAYVVEEFLPPVRSPWVVAALVLSGLLSVAAAGVGAVRLSDQLSIVPVATFGLAALLLLTPRRHNTKHQ